MSILWMKHFEFKWGYVEIIFDPCDLMIGVCWGHSDMVIKPFPGVCIISERYQGAAE